MGLQFALPACAAACVDLGQPRVERSRGSRLVERRLQPDERDNILTRPPFRVSPTPAAAKCSGACLPEGDLMVALEASAAGKTALAAVACWLFGQSFCACRGVHKGPKSPAVQRPAWTREAEDDAKASEEGHEPQQELDFGYFECRPY